MGRIIEFWLHPERFVRVNKLIEYCIDRHQELQDEYSSYDDDGDFDDKVRAIDELAQIEGKQSMALEIGRKFHPEMDVKGLNSTDEGDAQ